MKMCQMNQVLVLKKIRESDILKGDSNLNFPRKRELSKIFQRKCLRIVQIFVTQYFKINGIIDMEFWM